MDRRQNQTFEVTIDGHKVFLTVDSDPNVIGIWLDLAPASFDGIARAWANAWAISTSKLLQRGYPLDELIDSIKYTQFEPRGIVRGYDKVSIATSILDLVGKILENEFSYAVRVTRD